LRRSRANVSCGNLLGLWCGLLLACGARTPLDDGVDEPPAPPDGGADTGVRVVDVDAGPDGGTTVSRRDAGADAGPDAGGVVLGECARDGDCVRSFCSWDRGVAPRDLAPVPLVCAPTETPNDGDFCETADDCVRGLCVLAGTCVPPCRNDADCGMGQRCTEVYARTGDEEHQPMRGCVAQVDAAPGVRVGGGMERARGGEVELPGKAANETVLHLLGAFDDPGARFLPVRMTGDGAVLYDLEAIFAEGEVPRNPVVPGLPMIGVYVPNGPRVPGRVDGFVLTSEGLGGRVPRTTLRRRDGRAGRVLDVDLFYVGGARLGPTGDAGPPIVARALRFTTETWGLRLGEVRQHEVRGGLRDRFAVLLADPASGEMPELFQLLRLSAGAGRSSLSIFFVRSTDTALGVAGGIPGPMGANGTPMSGLVLAVDLLTDPGSPVGVDEVMAHEVGHYLGLFHTSEGDGTVLDPLPDTPACGIENDADGDGTVFAFECEGLGADNLMFWGSNGDEVSAQQREVVQRALLLR